MPFLRRTLFAVTALPLALLSISATAQNTRTTVKDSSMLKPPAGFKVAIVEWEDMECPQCARAFPLLKDASTKYKMPWVQYDFPLGAMHPWSGTAALQARWFDEKSKDLGNAYRGRVFEGQMYLHPDNIAEMAQNFAKSHGMQFPFVVDPQGKYAAEVKADHDLGSKMGLNHTPTIFIVTDGAGGAQQYTEILDLTKLYETIDGVIRQTGGVADAKAAPAASAHHAAAKKKS